MPSSLPYTMRWCSSVGWNSERKVATGTIAENTTAQIAVGQMGNVATTGSSPQRFLVKENSFTTIFRHTLVFRQGIPKPRLCQNAIDLGTSLQDYDADRTAFSPIVILRLIPDNSRLN